MKRHLPLLALLFCASAHAYTLVDYAHNEFPHSFDELAKSINPPEEILKPYSCSRPGLHDLFERIGPQNERRDSLQIGAKNPVIYREGKLFERNGKPTKPRGSFVKATLLLMEELERTETGSKLLRELESARYPVTISDGDRRFLPYYAGERIADLLLQRFT